MLPTSAGICDLWTPNLRSAVIQNQQHTAGCCACAGITPQQCCCRRQRAQQHTLYAHFDKLKADTLRKKPSKHKTTVVVYKVRATQACQVLQEAPARRARVNPQPAGIAQHSRRPCSAPEPRGRWHNPLNTHNETTPGSAEPAFPLQ
jgi:hypothetical protein